jgi:hypothetical protein
LADRKDICNKWQVFVEVSDLPAHVTSKFISSVTFKVKAKNPLKSRNVTKDKSKFEITG